MNKNRMRTAAGILYLVIAAILFFVVIRTIFTDDYRGEGDLYVFYAIFLAIPFLIVAIFSVITGILALRRTHWKFLFIGSCIVTLLSLLLFLLPTGSLFRVFIQFFLENIGLRKLSLNIPLSSFLIALSILLGFSPTVLIYLARGEFREASESLKNE